jgi:hypothetical protein|tara:strand:+ start:284 stop:538 length:255 start_codon:yes stop_codon:yes gene_type:complete
LLDGGKARHCGRDEYVAYMRRVAEHCLMPVHEHAKVVDIKRNTSTGRFSVCTPTIGAKCFSSSTLPTPSCLPSVHSVVAQALPP